MSLKIHSVLREWHIVLNLSELDIDFLAYIFQNLNMGLKTSQRLLLEWTVGKSFNNPRAEIKFVSLAVFPEPHVLDTCA